MNTQTKTWVWIGIAVVILIIILSSSGQNSNTSGQSTNQPVQPQGISISQVQIENLQLGKMSYGLSGYQLTGKVTNNSSTPFQGIDMTIEAYDCPGETINSDCTHIGENKNVLVLVEGNSYGEFPPNQVREAQAVAVDLSGMPPIQGNFLWSYTVTGFWNGIETIPVTL